MEKLKFHIKYQSFSTYRKYHRILFQPKLSSILNYLINYHSLINAYNYVYKFTVFTPIMSLKYLLIILILN